ncbi:hypothetical protein [Micromonospora carbonacea]|uniref:Uncharacterized protein n=1 Tax=Micromonospora carbonacea TaxID=47853 RepID=A0A1C4UL74_9ACTN|nr:hypothetical protein [Micromonospora carbonacea]SCE72417.1 hypothetical protein GA0070563_101597 [Micromonospora carbonacea]
MPPRRTLGSITVTALTDGEGPFFQPREEAFPAATAERWAAADRRDPGAVTGDGRRVSRATLLRDLAARGPAALATPHLGEPFVAL